MNIILSELRIQHATKKYLSWLKDFETNRYTEFRYQNHSIVTIKKYITNNIRSRNSYLYGIFIKKKNKKKIHIGNIKLGEINFMHKFGEISYFIGEKKYLNKKIAYKAIKIVLNLAKKKLNLRKIYAGTYSNNIISKKVLLKSGFNHEAKIKKKFLFNNIYVDHEIFSINL